MSHLNDISSVKGSMTYSYNKFHDRYCGRCILVPSGIYAYIIIVLLQCTLNFDSESEVWRVIVEDLLRKSKIKALK